MKNLKIAGSTGLVNTSMQIIDLGTISNVPSSSSIFELQVKKNGGALSDKVYIEEIIIYYECQEKKTNTK